MSTGTGLLGGEGGGTYGEDGEARTSLGTQGRGGAQTSGGAAATYVPENSVSRPLSGEFGKGGDGQVGVDSQSAGAGGGAFPAHRRAPAPDRGQPHRRGRARPGPAGAL